MFNLQMFGANDTVTSSSELIIGLLRTDKKSTQTYKFPNPKNDLSSSTVLNMGNEMLNNYFVDSKTGEVLTQSNSAVDTAYKKEQTIRTLDLSLE